MQNDEPIDMEKLMDACEVFVPIEYEEGKKYFLVTIGEHQWRALLDAARVGAGLSKLNRGS